MNYEQRMRQIQKELSRFQARYTPPRAMSTEAQAETFEAVCSSINRKLPGKMTPESLTERLKRVFDHVSDRHETNAWPLQSEYAKAVNATAGNAGDAKDDWRVNSVKIIARRIKAGEPVGGEWLYGRPLRELKALGGITDEDVAPYRLGQFYDDWHTTNNFEEAFRRDNERLER